MNSWDSSLVWCLLTSWWPAWQLCCFDPHTCTCTGIRHKPFSKFLTSVPGLCFYRCLSVHGRGGVLPQDGYPSGQTHTPWADTPRQTPPRQTPPGQTLSMGRLPRQTPPRQTPQWDGHHNRWYASYWKRILVFVFEFLNFHEGCQSKENILVKTTFTFKSVI